MALVRSLYRSASSVRSSVVGTRILNASLSQQQQQSHTLFTLSPCSSTSPFKRVLPDCRSPFGMAIGSMRTLCQDVTHYPDFKDLEIFNVFKDFMAADWGELPNAVISDALKVLSKSTDDTTGKDALKNVFRAAEACEEFIGTLETLKMALDDYTGLSGENVKPLSDELVRGMEAALKRYMEYLNSFGPDESYLKKKVETELGRRMIHVKMRCGSLDSEWGKVSVLGTSGIAGSYVEQRGP